jgi:hypothetical protein
MISRFKSGLAGSPASGGFARGRARPLRRRQLFALLLPLGLLGPMGAALADPPRAVVELFTSQGCSSCPPADAALVDLAKRSDVIALTLPVDYWDYLGWKDTLAQPGFTARQRAYAHLRGDRQVYTPQIVVNGTKPTVGSDRAEIDRAIAGEPGKDALLPVTVATSERDGIVTVQVDGAAEHQATSVWVLPVRKIQTVEISRGENKGRKVTYANVVRGIVRIGEWRGGTERFEIPLITAQADGDGYVVLLQSTVKTKPGVIIGATKSSGL